MAKQRDEETVIAHGVRVEGDFASQGAVLIEGDVKGTIQVGGDLRIGESSHVEADVTAQNAIIGGTVKGNLRIIGRLELQSSAQVDGDISVETLSVQSGAKINGSLNMSGKAVVDQEVDDEA